ncbi:unnamed protein product, partial [Allacma fusca]
VGSSQPQKAVQKREITPTLDDPTPLADMASIYKFL